MKSLYLGKPKGKSEKDMNWDYTLLEYFTKKALLKGSIETKR